jgi:hypothetical protein
MGLTKRMPWPEGYQQLAADRIAKGFSVVQIVAGLYPDMDGGMLSCRLTAQLRRAISSGSST